MTPRASSARRGASALHAIMAIAFGTALALTAPSLTAVGDGVPLAAAGLALALVALLGIAARWLILVIGPGSATTASGGGAPPVLPGRATDPQHHPVRPRAPGLA